MDQDASHPPFNGGSTAASGSAKAGALPISKLRGLSAPVRAALKQRRITTCGQLLRAAAWAQARARLAREAGIEPETLTLLVRRADMARVNGIGTVFGLMLEQLGVRDVRDLAAADPSELQERLRRLNAEERIARRSPTVEEVADWVAQAQALPPLVSY